MVDLSVKIGDITLQNPVTPASGAFSWEYNDVIDLNRLGGLVAKTICREPRLGNPTPRMAETEAGIIQSIGLPGKAPVTRISTLHAPASTQEPKGSTLYRYLAWESRFQLLIASRPRIVLPSSCTSASG